MKSLNHFILTIFLVVLSHETIKSQTYVPFPNSGIIWNIITTNDTFDPHSPYKNRYGLIGDTLINDTLYSKLYVLENDTNLNIINGSYVGAIRENNKHVYYKDISFPTKDILLYDFSLQQGDTMYYDYYGFLGNIEPYINSHFNVVANIDSILINNKYRKRFNFENSDIWIEGIGSIFGQGLIHPIAQYPLNGDVVTVACIKHNDTILHLGNPLCDKCFCSLNIRGIENNKVRLYVFPNPVTSVFNIRFDYIEREVYNLSIIDCVGKKVFSKINIKKGNISINKENLNSGLYFIILKNDKGRVYSEKIIIE
ncbi:MAG: hypothetical protein DRI94_13455 [Bacteroidetes bacterium]|nr:MAG: hypothetical protein DRI94_13455 [Bacteroidota bacterium]